MNRLVYQSINEDQFVAEHRWLKSFGNHNEMPAPFKPGTWHEYWHKRGSYSPEYTEHRQILGLGRTMKTVIVEWFHDCAAINKRHGGIYYKDTPQYYRIGCAHVLDELSVAECQDQGIYHAGNCYHVHKCRECGYVSAVDSSD